MKKNNHTGNLLKAIEDNSSYSPTGKNILKFFLVLHKNYQVQVNLKELRNILGITRDGLDYALKSLEKFELIKWDKAYKLRTFYLNKDKLKEIEKSYIVNEKFKKSLIDKKITPS